MAVTVLSDRGQNVIVIKGTADNIDGDQSVSFALPSGLGRVAISEIGIYVTTIATKVASETLLGPVAYIRDANAAVDVCGVGRWTSLSATAIASDIDPDSMIPWGDGESLVIAFNEVDTNVTPTADLQVYVRALRLISGSEMPVEFRLTS